MTVDVRDVGFGGPVRDGLQWLRDVDQRLSPFRTESEISRYQRGDIPEPSPDLRELLNLIQHGEHESARVVSGIVTAWAVQRLAEWLRVSGAENFRINAGADVITAGRPRPRRVWQLGIPHPWLTDQMCALLPLADRSVATAGRHVQAPEALGAAPGLPADVPHTIAVLTADLAVAHITARSALARGTAGVAWADAQPDCLVVAVTADGLLRCSAELDGLIERA